MPFILTRTPYGIGGAAGNFITSYAEMADERYIFVFQDIRGRFDSEGQFVMLRSPRDRKDNKAIDEYRYLGYDRLAAGQCAAQQRACGTTGSVLPGWLTVMSMLDPHPALKAVSPQASPASMFIGDDFHHNGAFRLAYGFEYVAMMESGKGMNRFAFDKVDNYSWHLENGPLSNIDRKYFKGERPTWNDFVAHPNFDAFWKREALAQYLDRVNVPTLNVGGWWDQEDFTDHSPSTRNSRNTTPRASTISSWAHGITADGVGVQGRRWAISILAARRRRTSGARSRRHGSRTG